MLAIRRFEYVRGTPQLALVRLRAETVGDPPVPDSAPALMVLGDAAHRFPALGDPTGWLVEIDDTVFWRLAWRLPTSLLAGDDRRFLLDLPGVALLDLPLPVECRAGQDTDVVRRAMGGRLGVVTALLASGAIAMGATTAGAQAQPGEYVIDGPEGPLLVTVDCTPSGWLADGRACILPECPPPEASDGTPCLEPAPAPEPAEAVPVDRTAPGEPAGPVSAQPPVEADAAPGSEEPARPEAEAVPVPEPEAGAKKKSKRGTGRSKGAKRSKPGSERRQQPQPPEAEPPDGPAAPAPQAVFRRKQRQAAARWRAERRRQRTVQRQAERAADAEERREAARLRALARTIDRSQDAPVTGGVVLPGLAIPDPPEPPGFLKPIYKEAGRKHGVPWQILASINEIETQYGRLLGPSPAGAVGWMQFMPATWKAYGVDADGDGVKDPDDPRDAIFAAARYLEASGARRDLPRAIFAYNHADWYVQAVLLRAREMRWRDPEVTKLLRLRRWQLERRVLADERIEIYGCGREDIRAHRIDRRVLLVLQFLADSELHPTVTSLDCGHSVLTKSGRVSHHSFGGAVDIAAINGTPILGNQGAGSVTEAVIRRLVTLRGIMAPDQIISLIEVNGAENTISMNDHADHIHVGFRPRKDVRAKREKLRRKELRRRALRRTQAQRRYAELSRHPDGIFRRLSLPVAQQSSRSKKAGRGRADGRRR